MDDGYLIQPSFPSTHPVWGGTPPRKPAGMRKRNFNPPTPCGVGLMHGSAASLDRNFNPPTPCGVGQAKMASNSRWDQFQSTHPVWGGTTRGGVVVPPLSISIHPPRVGWDLCCFYPFYRSVYFNPPTPCGVGLSCTANHKIKQNFNPPTPCGVGPAITLLQ